MATLKRSFSILVAACSALFFVNLLYNHPFQVEVVTISHDASKSREGNGGGVVATSAVPEPEKAVDASQASKGGPGLAPREEGEASSSAPSFRSEPARRPRTRAPSSASVFQHYMQKGNLRRRKDKEKQRQQHDAKWRRVCQTVDQ